MSGVFGLIDPEGRFSGALDAAVDSLVYRGDPQMSTCGPATFGVCGADGTAVAGDAHSILAADGWVYEGLDDIDTSLDLDGLLHLVARDGISVLDSIAGVFAVATYSTRSDLLVLSRDAFGSRPLYYSASGRARAFSSDPWFLIHLGFASGEVSESTTQRHALGGLIPGDASEFVGVRRVAGGRWVELGPRGRRGGRWFRPERFLSEAPSDADPSVLIAQAVEAALKSTLRAGRASLSLSAGRDSASLAISAARIGMPIDAFTFDLASAPTSEVPAARRLAEDLGIPWRALDIPAEVDEADLRAFVGEVASPLLPPAFPITMCLAHEIRARGTQVVIDGEGGDLFCAPPIALLDLLWRGRFADLLRSVGGYKRYPGWGITTQLKMVGRSIAPRGWLNGWDRARGRGSAPSRDSPVFSARGELLRQLVATGDVGTDEISERVFAKNGAVIASPLLDIRVVRALMSVRTAMRVPSRTYKPLLKDAFLGEVDGTRMKATHVPYYRELASSLAVAYPDLALIPTPPRRRYLIAQPHDVWVHSLRSVGPRAWRRWGSTHAAEHI